MTYLKHPMCVVCFITVGGSDCDSYFVRRKRNMHDDIYGANFLASFFQMCSFYLQEHLEHYVCNDPAEGKAVQTMNLHIQYMQTFLSHKTTPTY